MTLNRAHKKAARALAAETETSYTQAARQLRARLTCASCGRSLTNDPTQPNAAAWTLVGDRVPYCADSNACRADAEEDF